MKRLVVALAMLLFAASAIAGKPAKLIGPPMADFSKVRRAALPAEIEMIRTAMQDRLKDADSAKFRNVYVIGKGGGICGEVNAKNGYGAYAGYRAFNGFMFTNGTNEAVNGVAPGGVTGVHIFVIDTEDKPVAAAVCAEQM